MTSQLNLILGQTTLHLKFKNHSWNIIAEGKIFTGVDIFKLIVHKKKKTQKKGKEIIHSTKHIST